jgi:hypothetical protein
LLDLAPASGTLLNQRIGKPLDPLETMTALPALIFVEWHRTEKEKLCL